MKRSSLTQLFLLFETKTVFTFFAILQVLSWGPCLVFGFHTLCLVPLCVCQTLYLREFSYCFAGWHSNKKFCMPNSKTGGGDWKKSRLLLPVNVYLAFRCFFSSRVNWKFSSSFTTRYVDRVFICLKSGIKIQLYRFFPLKYADRLLFPQSGWKDPALHNFSCYSKRRQCLLIFFCDSTRLVMRSVPCLWFSHFVPCAFVCVCQTLYLREFSYCFAGWHSNKKFCMPNSKTGGKVISFLPVDTLTVVSFVSRADWKSSFTGVFCP